MNGSSTAKQITSDTATVKPGLYEVEFQSQKIIVVVPDEQSTDGPVRALQVVRSEHNARRMRKLDVSIDPEHAAVLNLYVQLTAL